MDCYQKRQGPPAAELAGRRATFRLQLTLDITASERLNAQRSRSASADKSAAADSAWPDGGRHEASPSPVASAFCSQLQAHLSVKIVGSLAVHIPTLPPQQNVDAPESIADAGRADLLVASLQAGLVGSTRAIVD